MTPEHAQTSNTRRALVQSTRRVHQALHNDPVLSRLVAKNIKQEEYFRALQVFFEFFQGIEGTRRQLGRWEQFSLNRECLALCNDLGTTLSRPKLIRFEGADEMLGGLYVAHGAGFGRSSFRRNIRRHLPYAPHQFICLPPESAHWRELNQALEHSGRRLSEKKALIDGAQKAFEAVKWLASYARNLP